MMQIFPYIFETPHEWKQHKWNPRSQRPSVPQSTNFFWNQVTGSNVNILFLGPRINTYPEESYFLIFLQHKRKDAFFHITPTLEHIHREDVAGNETSNFDLAQATITFWHSVFYIIKMLNTKIWKILLKPTCRGFLGKHACAQFFAQPSLA